MPSHYIILAFMKKHACTYKTYGELHFYFQTVKFMETKLSELSFHVHPSSLSWFLSSQKRPHGPGCPSKIPTYIHAHTHTHIHTPASLSSLAVTSVVCGRSFGARGEMAGRRESYGIKICYSFLSRIFTELNTHIHTSRYTGASCCVRVL